MFKNLMPYLWLVTSFSALGQIDDLPAQLLVVKNLLPTSARVGMVYNPKVPDIDALISKASKATGLAIYKAPVAGPRDMTNAIRSLSKYKVDFIFLIEDKRVTGTQTIKFVVKQTMRKKVPVFTTSANTHQGGGFGWLVENEGSWRIKINSKMRTRFDFTIPEDSKFVIEE